MSATLAASPHAAVPEEPIWRLSVRDYHEMIHLGILTEDDPVELLEGWLTVKMPKSPQRTTATDLTRLAVEAILPAGWFARSQEPITTIDSEPEPDVFVVRGQRRDFAMRQPQPEQVALVVEVADSSLRRDRSLKKRIYARAGISEYWIVNLTERRVEVSGEPSGPGETPDYQVCREYADGQSIPVRLDGCEAGAVAVAELLP